uniref:Elongator complex protein 1 n=2 Tax=Schistocephalus solidus TaxID=70667 RepID=A0A0X3PLM4_SCHSO
MGEVDLQQTTTGSEHLVSVGWGSKETQFKGQKRRTEDIAEVQVNTSQLTSFSPEITWREDSRYFAVLWTDSQQSPARRRIRIFNQNGDLQSTSEETPGLETGLSWRPKVQLITTSRRRNQRGLDLVFFELNGLQHGELELLPAHRASHYRVQDIQFERTDYIMAVLLVPTGTDGRNLHPLVRLHTTSNYHWYVKAELPVFSLQSTYLDYPVPVVRMALGKGPDFGAFSIAIATSVLETTAVSRTEVRTWVFASTVDRSCVSSSTLTHTWSPSLVATIDADVVRLTDFTRSVVPPPMCATKLSFASPDQACIAVVCLPGPWATGASETGTHCNCLPLFVQMNESPVAQTVVSNERNPPMSVSAAAFWIEIERGWPSSERTVSLCEERITVEREQVAPEAAACPREAWLLTEDSLTYKDGDASPAWLTLSNRVLHSVWIDFSSLCFVNKTGRAVCMLTKLTGEVSPRFQVSCLATVQTSDSRHIIGLANGPGGKLAIQLEDGEVFTLLVHKEEATGRVLPFSHVSTNLLAEVPFACRLRLPFACDHFFIVQYTSFDPPVAMVGAGTGVHRNCTKHLLFGLQSSSHRLCAVPWPDTTASVVPVEEEEGRCVMQLCSSTALHSHFLLVTSLQDKLFCLPLSLPGSEFRSVISSIENRLRGVDMNPGHTPVSTSPANNAPRLLEGGARIITAETFGTKVVLQMPRGNLEVIHPPALVFDYLRPLYDSCQYATAIQVMRRHRVNFNLIYDYSPNKFLTNISNFVRQMESVDYITLLITDLREEDTAQTILSTSDSTLSPDALLASNVAKIRDCLPKKSLMEPRSSTKVNLVCDALLKAMLTIDSKRYLLPILTCYVKKQPSEVEKGLLLLKDLCANGDIQAWDRGLRHLQYFLTPINLFHIALGTYDLDLAEAMAARTQLDPKEYQPCLQELRSLMQVDEDKTHAEAYQHARIDLMLERYMRALENLRAAGPLRWEEFIELVKKQKLFSFALEFFPPDSPQFSAISRLWAKSLESTNDALSAGRIYLRACHFLSASRAFVSANACRLWMLTVDRARFAASQSSSSPFAAEENLTEEEIRRQAAKLAPSLLSLSRFQEAASVYADYLQDFAAAVNAAAQGGLWPESHQLALRITDTDLISTVIKKQALHLYSGLCDQFSSMAENFHTNFRRLAVVRAAIRAKLSENETGDNMFEDTESELLSETGSVVSGSSSCSRTTASSRASGRSQKSRRKSEKKKWSTKLGSRFEEVGLIHSLYKSIESMQQLVADVQSLTEELWFLGETEAAKNLARRANGILLDHRASISTIWCNEITGAEINGNAPESGLTQRRYQFHGK